MSEEISPKTQAPIVDLAWIHKTSKLIGPQENESAISEPANDSRERLSTLPEEHRIVVVLN